MKDKLFKYKTYNISEYMNETPSLFNKQTNEETMVNVTMSHDDPRYFK